MASPDYTAVTKADLEAFLAAKGANRPCEACARADWDIADEPLWFTLELSQFFPIAGTGPDGVTRQRKMVMPVVYVECANCSHIRIFQREAIIQWLEENQAGINE